eukprot:363797-Chlamydomonas_euryale.AAC.11
MTPPTYERRRCVTCGAGEQSSARATAAAAAVRARVHRAACRRSALTPRVLKITIAGAGGSAVLSHSQLSISCQGGECWLR